jgi:hypothetical protein
MPIVLKAFEWDDGFLKKEGQTDADVDWSTIRSFSIDHEDQRSARFTSGSFL